MITKTNVSGWTREQWLAERKKSIGGSDAGAVMGLSKYKGRVAVWAEKVDGEIRDEHVSESMRLGIDLEDYVAHRFSERTGLKVRNNHLLIRNTDYPQLHANIDRSIVGENACLECKTASAYMAEEWADGKFPPSYYAQVATYMLVGGFERVYLAVLIFNVAFKVYCFTRSSKDEPKPEWLDEMIYVSPAEMEALNTATREFWDTYVATGKMPDADAAPTTSEVLNELADQYQTEDAEPIDLDDMALALMELSRIEQQISDLTESKEEIKNQIKQRMLTSPEAWCEDLHITWKPQKHTTFDWRTYFRDNPTAPDHSKYIKTNENRVLRIKQSK